MLACYRLVQHILFSVGIFWPVLYYYPFCYYQPFCKTSFKLWRYNLWSNFEKLFSSADWVYPTLALAITGAIRGTSKGKLYQELGFKSLQSTKWFRKLLLFYKIIKIKVQLYIFHLFPKPSTLYPTCQSSTVPSIKVNIRTSPSYSRFKKRILEFIRHHP